MLERMHASQQIATVPWRYKSTPKYAKVRHSAPKYAKVRQSTPKYANEPLVLDDGSGVSGSDKTATYVSCVVYERVYTQGRIVHIGASEWDG